MSIMQEGRDNAGLAVEEPANVLLRASSMSDGAREVCPSVTERSTRNLLVVSLSGDPKRRLDVWKRQDGLPEKVAILSVDTTRGGASTRSTGSAGGPGGAAVSTTTVSEPSDLTGIGIKINQCLSAWADDDAPVEVCFDSVTTLLQYVDQRRAFRFLHVISKRITSIGGVAHYHVDPAAHDEQTLATIENVFSDIYEYDADTASWTATR